MSCPDSGSVVGSGRQAAQHGPNLALQAARSWTLKFTLSEAVWVRSKKQRTGHALQSHYRLLHPEVCEPESERSARPDIPFDIGISSAVQGECDSLNHHGSQWGPEG